MAPTFVLPFISYGFIGVTEPAEIKRDDGKILAEASGELVPVADLGCTVNEGERLVASRRHGGSRVSSSIAAWPYSIGSSSS